MTMTLCTEKDSNFIEYKDKIENRKITFPIKEFFKAGRLFFKYLS